MTDKQQPDKFDWATELSDAQGHVTLSGQKLYLAAPPTAQAGGWRPIETAPEGQMVVVGWLDKEDTETPERHDFDLLEDGCWQRWHDHAEHVQIIGGHGVSYTAPYTVWMPIGAIPPTSAEGVEHG